MLTRVFASDIQRLNPRMNLLHLAWGVGATLGPLAAIGLGLSSDQLYSTYATIAGVGVILSLPLLMLSSPKIARMEDPPDDIDSSSVARRVEQQSLPRPGVAQSIVFLCFFFSLRGHGAVIGEWIAVFATNAPVATERNSGSYCFCVLWQYVDRPPPRGRFDVERRLGSIFTPARLIGGSLLVALASLLLLAFSGAYNVGGLFVAVTGIGLSFSSIYPTAITLAQSKFQATGSQTSMFVSGAPLGGIVWPTTIGVLMRAISTTAMPWAGLILALFCTVCFGIILCTRVRPVERIDVQVLL